MRSFVLYLSVFLGLEIGCLCWYYIPSLYSKHVQWSLVVSPDLGFGMIGVVTDDYNKTNTVEEYEYEYISKSPEEGIIAKNLTYSLNVTTEPLNRSTMNSTSSPVTSPGNQTQETVIIYNRVKNVLHSMSHGSESVSLVSSKSQSSLSVSATPRPFSNLLWKYSETKRFNTSTSLPPTIIEIRRRYYGLRRSSYLKTKDWRLYYNKMASYEKMLSKGIKTVMPVTPKPIKESQPIVDDPYFNGLDPVSEPTVHYRYKRYKWSKNETIRIRKFENNREIQVDLQDVYPNATQPISITFIAVGTFSRVFFIPHLVNRWKGPFSFVFYGNESYEDRFLDYFSRRCYDPHVSIILYLVKNGTESAATFPINSLRNIGIRNSRSSHYVVFDFDVWPTLNLYDELLLIPKSVLIDNKSLVIVPIFFYDLGILLPQCHEFSSCIKLGDSYFPENRVSLNICIQTRVCMYHKSNLFTHAYTNKSWLSWTGRRLTELKCVMNDFQEPYTMLQRSPETPLYDERYVNYGYNKVQLIEQLRYMNYKFYIIMTSHAMDMPHRYSKFRSSFSNSFNTTDSMKNLYSQSQIELVNKYGSNPYVKICSSEKLLDVYIPVIG